jgi:hypothetical protein
VRFLIALCMLMLTLGVQAQQSSTATKPSKPCRQKKDAEFPFDYRHAILQEVRPPAEKRPALTIEFGRLAPLVLTLDRNEARLWSTTSTFDDMDKKINQLYASCKLEAYPSRVVDQLEIEWESTDLTMEEFADLHRALLDAMGKYSAGAQPIYEGLARDGQTSIYLDAWQYFVIYKTEYQFMEVDPIADPKVEANRAILAWIHRVDKLAETKFHRPFPDAMDDR